MLKSQDEVEMTHREDSMSDDPPGGRPRVASFAGACARGSPSPTSDTAPVAIVAAVGTTRPERVDLLVDRRLEVRRESSWNLLRAVLVA